MYKINLYYITKLKNQEFPAAYEMICSMLEEEELTVEDVAESYENVKAHIDKLHFLQNMKLQHPLTRTIRRLADQRNDYLRSLKGRVVSALTSPVETERKAAEVLNLWLHGYREYLSRARIHEQNVLVGQMMNNYQSKLAIQEAVADAGVQPFLDSISSITGEIKAALVTRAQEKTAAKRIAMALRRAAYRDLKIFFTSLQMAIVLNKNDSAIYQRYLNEVNDIMEQFKGKYESRITRRKNASEKADENQPENHENDDQDGDTTPTDSQPESAGTSRKFNVVTLDGMDSHNGVMSNSVTNGKVIDGKKNEPSNGNGNFVNDDVHSPEKAIAMYNGTSNGIDQKS
ncbi:MAG: DUF6261 family protein [Dysgonamonadaceae bacterium]|nr:DUF6261 family protein [Dysgonamonadaceae bacterium]